MMGDPIMVTVQSSGVTIIIRYGISSDLAPIQAISEPAYGVYVAAIGQKPVPLLADKGVRLADDVSPVAGGKFGAVRGTRFTNAYTSSLMCVPEGAVLACGDHLHRTDFLFSAKRMS